MYLRDYAPDADRHGKKFWRINFALILAELRLAAPQPPDIAGAEPAGETMPQTQLPKRASPDELALKPSYRNTWFYLAFAAGLLIFALWFRRSIDPIEFFWSRIMAVLAVAGMAACIYTFIACGGRGLFLDRRGFRVSTAWGTRVYRWSDVGAFHVTSDTDGVKSVAFAAGGSPSRTTVGKVARWFSHTTLPSTYRMQAEALAALMNEWRDRAAARTS